MDIWKGNVSLRVKAFLWKVHRYALPTRAFLLQRDVVRTDSCPLCASTSENIFHIIRDCPFARQIWERLGILGYD